eukprot:g22269.t1
MPGIPSGFRAVNGRSMEWYKWLVSLLRARSWLRALELLRRDVRGKKVSRPAAEHTQVSLFWNEPVLHRPRWAWALDPQPGKLAKLELLVADDHDDLRHVNQALLILARAAQWEEALCVFLHRIERLKVKVDIVSVNSVALALANVARWQRALALTQPWWPLATDGGTARAICMLS